MCMWASKLVLWAYRQHIAQHSLTQSPHFLLEIFANSKNIFRRLYVGNRKEVFLETTMSGTGMWVHIAVIGLLADKKMSVK